MSRASATGASLPALSSPFVVLLDNQGCIRQLNSSACRLLEARPEEIMGKVWFSLCIPEAWRAFAIKVFRQTLAKGLQDPAFYITAPLQSASGQQYRLDWYVEPLFDNEGISGAILTGLHAGSEAAGSAEDDVFLQATAQNQAVLDNAAEAIINVDIHGTITGANKATASIFGYTIDELIGQNINSLLPEANGHSGKIPEAVGSQSGPALSPIKGRELTGHRKDRSEITLELYVTEVNVHDKTSYTWVIRDVSERRATELQLRQNTEELQLTRDRLAHLDRLHIAAEMSTGIAHELNQPLAAIAMYAQACRRAAQNSYADNELLLDSLSRIDEQAQRAGEVIRSLHSLVSKQKPRRELSDINELLHNTVELARMNIDAHGIAIEYQLSGHLPKIRVVYPQIQQVLLNLIRNACDALSASRVKDKKIAIASELDNGSQIKITVRDNGDGVAIKNAARVFEPFFTTKNPDHGMGMGLAISRSIIESHGGVLKINTNYKLGAEFFFTLPIAASKAR